MNKNDYFTFKDIVAGVIICLILIVLSFVFIYFFSFVFDTAKNLFKCIENPFVTVALMIGLTVVAGIFTSLSNIHEQFNIRKFLKNIFTRFKS